MFGAWRFELQTSCRWLVFECAILLASILSNFRIASLCDTRGRRDGIGERHTDPVLRPQNDHRTSFDCLTWSQLKIVFSEQVAQDHKDLQHRVISTDATSRSSSEGKEGEGRAQLVVRFGETLGIEIFRILPVARSMVRTVHIYNDRRTAGNGQVAYAVVRHRHAVNHPKRR